MSVNDRSAPEITEALRLGEKLVSGSADPGLVGRRLDELWRYGSRNAFVLLSVYVCHRGSHLYSTLWDVLRTRLLEMLAASGTGVNLTAEARAGLDHLAAEGYLPEWTDLSRSPAPPAPVEPGRIPLLLVDKAADFGHVLTLDVSGARPGEPPANDLDLGFSCALLQEICCQREGRRFFLHGERFRAWVTAAGREFTRPLTGRSYELPLFLALASRLIGRALPVDIAATARIDKNGYLQPVAGVAAKIAALCRERPGVRRLLIADGQPDIDKAAAAVAGELEIVSLSTAAAALDLLFPGLDFAAVLKAPYDLDDELRRIEADFQGYRLHSCHANASRLLEEPGLSPDARFKALWYRGGCRCHFGRIDAALADFEAAEKLYRVHGEHVNFTDYAEMRNHYGVGLKDVFRYEDARGIFEENRRIFDQCRASSLMKAKNLSSLSQLESAVGRHDEAIARQREALELLAAARKPLSRNRGYLVNICSRAGRFEEAAVALKEAREALRDEGREEDPGREFIDWYEAELLYRCLLVAGGDAPKIVAALDSLAARYPRLDPRGSHAPALVWKFVGLGRLRAGNAAAARPFLDGAISFFEESEVPMYLLLAASIRLERLRLGLLAGVAANAGCDLETFVAHLNVQPDIRRFFAPYLAALSLPEDESLAVAATDREAFTRNLAKLVELIPY